jgi:hypothetical protein
MKKIITALLLVTILTTSCSEKEDAISSKDTVAPVVRILESAPIQQFNTSDPLCITAKAFDEGVISTVSIKIVKAGVFAPLLQYDYNVNDRSFEVYKKIIIPSSFTGNCSLLLEATDTFGNKASVSKNFSAN